MTSEELTDTADHARVTVEDLTFVDRLCWDWHDPGRLNFSLKLLARRSAELAGTTGAAVFLIDRTGARPRLQASVEMTVEEKEAARRQVERAIAASEVISVGEGIAVTAMMADGRLHGAVAVPFAFEPPGPQSLEQIRVLVERAALSIARAHQCREVFERLSVVDSVLDISRAILSERELRPALKMIAERAARTINAELTAVGLIDWNTKELYYVESFGTLADSVTGARTPLTKSVRSLVSKSGEPVVINDVAADGRIPVEAIEEWGIRSLVVVPMRIRKKVIGALLAANGEGGLFADRDVGLLETIANHAAAAVAHADLHGRARAALGELEAEKTKIEAVLAQLGDGVVVCDAQNNVIMMNTAAESIVGIPARSALGRSLAELHPPLFRSEMELVMKQLALSSPDDGVFWEQNIRLPDRRVVRTNVRPVFLKTGAFLGTATVMQDVTERVELDEAKTEFMSTVAHEIRTPLTALKGSIGLILAGAAGNVDPSLAELLGIAQNNCNRLIRLVDDMLDMAKIESGHLSLEMEIVSVQERVLSAVRQMRHLAEEKQIRLISKVYGRPPSVVGDGDRIEQVVTNLLVNAVKFSPPSTVVEVVVRYAHGFVRVSVKDQGPGISRDEQKKVFEKFYRIGGQSAGKDGGSGLGLPISRGIVTQHGGKISVRSTPGKGSTFTFTLPVPGDEALLSDEEDG